MRKKKKLKTALLNAAHSLEKASEAIAKVLEVIPKDHVHRRMFSELESSLMDSSEMAESLAKL
jgi:hypothetical protein